MLSPSAEGDYVRFGEGVYFYITGDVHITPWRFNFMDNRADVTFTLSAGHTVERNYELFNNDHSETRGGPFYPSEDGIYLRGILHFRVWPTR